MPARKSASTRSVVSGVAGAASTTTSARPTTSGSRSGVTVRSVGSSDPGRRRQPITPAPKARARVATSVPIPPRPTTSHVVPATSRQSWMRQDRGPIRLRHAPASWNSSSTARMTNSAMGMLLTWALVIRTQADASREKTGAS